MKFPNSRFLNRIRDGIAQVVFGPPILAFLPALTLGAFWFGGETALLAAALGLPLLFALLGGFSRSEVRPAGRDGLTGLMLSSGFEAHVKTVFERTEDSGLKSALLVIEIDDFDELVAAHGQDAGDIVMQRCGERIGSALRHRDTVARIGRNRFAICLTPILQLDLELCIQLAGRIQVAVEEPIGVDGTSLFVSCSIGMCQRHRAPKGAPGNWLECTVAALDEAIGVGPSSIRAYSSDTPVHLHRGDDLMEDAAAALENGMIQAWFQPQISTDTGRVSGFEALARWCHPVKGMIPPSAFLPALEQAGLLQKLSQQMVQQALTAIKSWDAAGLKVPSVGVNFATDELRDPALINRIRWELDRFGLTADRLTVEVLETVMTDQPDEVVARNITALGEMGCHIDLDDFGTGHASIASVRRFRVSRIKIDRSFVTKSDHDPEQQKLIAAILTMAERLELKTLAEGVETVGEHALLAQLGCDHVQGFGIGRPMPFDQTLDWVISHEAKLQDAPLIGRQRH
ncbi:putative bifunctional diguanylate cyclase/phosphodiesterase [Tritonibacter horizontis]|uniref:Oxygen sensor protein DosP n=1 Tax=Tritonibacter horizontis TaxID=1768241 RepID=A0A132BUU3_9RHOB|nr:bifunctional diguanylate cyclase/phosphodiesterase [Tritonibacter horizontis]KUP92141.1 oxygen sensor protein DosP [Tritonibacter horizontis]